MIKILCDHCGDSIANEVEVARPGLLVVSIRRLEDHADPSFLRIGEETHFCDEECAVAWAVENCTKAEDVEPKNMDEAQVLDCLKNKRDSYQLLTSDNTDGGALMSSGQKVEGAHMAVVRVTGVGPGFTLGAFGHSTFYKFLEWVPE